MRWSQIRSIVNSKIASVTILTPLIGMFLIFNGKILDYIQLAEQFLIDTSQQNSDQSAATLGNLYYTYFGLTAFGIGTLLFILFCPEQIRHHSGEEDFYEKQSRHPAFARLLRAASYIFERLRKITAQPAFLRFGGSNVMNKIGRILSEIPGGSGLVMETIKDNGKHPREVASTFIHSVTVHDGGPADGPKINPAYGFELLILEYYVADRTLPVLRYFIAGIVLFGLLCAAVPGLRAFYKIALRAIAAVV